MPTLKLHVDTPNGAIGANASVGLGITALPPIVIDPISIAVTALPTIGVDVAVTALPTIGVSVAVTQLPMIDIKVEPLDIKVEPLDMSFRIKEIPSVRVHFPVDYRFCVALLGTELMSLQICGQGQVITEPYVANPCECRQVRVIGAAGEPVTPAQLG